MLMIYANHHRNPNLAIQLNIYLPKDVESINLRFG